MNKKDEMTLAAAAAVLGAVGLFNRKPAAAATTSVVTASANQATPNTNTSAAAVSGCYHSEV